MRPRLSASLRRRPRVAFTLIELLVVIAIIAILAAILFPVFGSVRESARRGNTMTKLHKIAQAVAAYELDNREYPEYLFGPAISQADGTPFGGEPYYSMKDVSSIVNKGVPSVGVPAAGVAQKVRRIYSKSLFPQYIRDLDTFSCDNNPIKTPNGAGDVAAVSRYLTYDPTNGVMARVIPMAPVAIPFYKYDAYDASPKLLDFEGKVDNATLVNRYSRAWYPISPNGAPVSGAEPDPAASDEARLAKYRRQLLWREPPTETLITLTTHHAPKSKVVTLWLSGAAKVLDVKKYKNLVDPAGDVKGYELGPGD